jgi:hypothetical protein
MKSIVQPVHPELRTGAGPAGMSQSGHEPTFNCSYSVINEIVAPGTNPEVPAYFRPLADFFC